MHHILADGTPVMTKRDFSFIVQEKANLDKQYIEEISQYVGLIYDIDDSDANPFDSAVTSYRVGTSSP